MYQIHLLEGRSTYKTSYPHTWWYLKSSCFSMMGMKSRKKEIPLRLGFLYGFLLRRIWSLLMTFVKGPRPGWTTRKGSERVGARCPGGCSQCVKIRVVLRECTRGRTTKHVTIYMYLYTLCISIYIIYMQYTYAYLLVKKHCKENPPFSNRKYIYRRGINFQPMITIFWCPGQVTKSCPVRPSNFT